MSRAAIFVLCVALLAGLLATSPTQSRPSAQSMNEWIYQALMEAQELLDADQPDAALARLTAVEARRINPYERAQVLRMIGLVHYQLDDLEPALDAFERALEQRNVPEGLQADLLGTLGRIGLMLDRDAYAEERLRALLAIEDQNLPENRILLAIALLKQEHFADAVPFIESAMDELRADGRVPRENWYSMLATAHFQQEDIAATREVMLEMVAYYPRASHLMNLAALHGQLGDRQRQLALVEALRDDDRIDRGSHLRTLAGLFMAEELPYKAAALLESGIEDGMLEPDRRTLEQLSQAWYMAQEHDRAIEVLIDVAEQEDDGELFMRLAGLQMDVYRWEDARVSATRAVRLGGLRDEGDAWLLIGMANVRLKRFDAAEQGFREARRFDDVRSYADQWLAYIENERRILAATR